MASRHEIILSLIVTRKIQITTTLRVHLTLGVMAVIKNKQTKQNTNQPNKKPSKNAGEDEGWGRTHIHCL